jgi:ligand-binding sensor domain-containing protein
MKKLVIWALFIVVQTWTGNLLAQSYQPVVLSLTSKDGLPSDNVYSVFQDSRGIMWFCTERGLVRYDGRNMRIYTQDDGLTDNEVLSMIEDASGRLWVTCFSRHCAVLKGDRFESIEKDSVFSPLTSTKNANIGLLQIRDNGNLMCFVNSSHRFFYYNRQLDTKVRDNLNLSMYYMELVDSFIYGYQKRAVVRVAPGGMAYEKVFDFSNIIGQGAEKYNIAAADGNVFCSFYGDTTLLIKRRGHTFRVVKDIIPQTGTVFIDQQKRYWVCSNRAGVFCYVLNEREEFVLIKSIFTDQRINTMFQDQEGTFWLSTKGNGIMAFREDFADYDSRFYNTNNNNSCTVNATRSGNWIGNAKGDVFEIIGQTPVKKLSITAPGAAKNIRQVYHDALGRTWVVSDDAVYLGNGNELERIQNIRSPKMLGSNTGKIYCAAASLLYVIDDAQKVARSMINQRLTSILVDNGNAIWAGALTGLFGVKDSTLQYWGTDFVVLSSRTKSIQEHEGALWVVNAAYGIVRAEKRGNQIYSATPLTDTDGQPFREVLPNVIFEKKRLIFATSKGICMVLNNGTVVKINMKTELTNSEITSIVSAGPGEVWVGTTRGILRKKLDDNPQIDTDYPVFVSDISFRNNDTQEKIDLLFRDQRDMITLPATASLVEIAFANLSSNFGEEVQYECQIIKGFSGFWGITWSNFWNWLLFSLFQQKETIVIDRNVFSLGVDPSPGYYEITAHALYPRQLRSQNSDTVRFVVRPKLYEILWVQLLFFLLLAFGFYIFYQSRLSLQKTRNKMLLLSFQTLQSQINPHFVGNTVNAFNQFFYPPDPAKASVYIQLFNNILRRTFELSNSTFTPFEEELGYINNYLAMMKIRLGDKFTYSIEVDDKMERTMPFPVLILQPILENATIHGINPTGPTHIQVVFVEEQGSIHCIVNDNGIGLNIALERRRESGRNKKSVGLDIIRNKAAILNTLHHLDMRFELVDRSDLEAGQTGTRATIVFKKITA